MTNKVKTLNVRGRVVEDALRGEVVEASLLRLKFKTKECKGFPVYQAHRRECTEGLSAVLQDLEVCGGVACVHYLHCLVIGFVDSSRRERDFVGRANLNHWNERLGAWGE